MTGQSDWLPMMMATGPGAPFTGARRHANRRNPWRLRLKEGAQARKRGRAFDQGNRFRLTRLARRPRRAPSTVLRAVPLLRKAGRRMARRLFASPALAKRGGGGPREAWWRVRAG